MSHGGHEIVKCSCGKIISQCRCIEGSKNVRVVKDGCKECQSKTQYKI